MLDPKWLRDDVAQVKKQLARRGFVLDSEQLQTLQARRKELQVLAESLQNERNTRSTAIGKAKAAGQDIAPLLAAVADLGERLQSAQRDLSAVQEELQNLALGLPNIPLDDVPEGRDETANRELRRWGEPGMFNFTMRDHTALGMTLLDAQSAAVMSGARFTVLHGALARLQRALIQFMLDVHTQEHGYNEVYVPYLVNADSLRGTGQLPKFADDLFAVAGASAYYLIPTAEVPVTNLVRDRILEDAHMPRKWVAHTPCFRAEAGSYGKDTRGLIRQHQFEKVELVQVVRPQDSSAALEELTGHAEALLQRLELPYRVMALCAGDLGFAAAKTYDLEVWLPSQQRYREISSCSNFEAFQARRLQARWRNPAHGKTEWVHTLNGSALAVGRTLAAIMENFQDEAGRIHIPRPLWPYMANLRVIEPSLV